MKVISQHDLSGTAILDACSPYIPSNPGLNHAEFIKIWALALDLPQVASVEENYNPTQCTASMICFQGLVNIYIFTCARNAKINVTFMILQLILLNLWLNYVESIRFPVMGMNTDTDMGTGMGRGTGTGMGRDTGMGMGRGTVERSSPKAGRQADRSYMGGGSGPADWGMYMWQLSNMVGASHTL